MTTDNSERIKAASEELDNEWARIGNEYRSDEAIADILRKYFGESAPEQKHAELVVERLRDFCARRSTDGEAHCACLDAVEAMVRSEPLPIAAPSVDTNAELRGRPYIMVMAGFHADALLDAGFVLDHDECEHTDRGETCADEGCLTRRFYFVTPIAADDIGRVTQVIADASPQEPTCAPDEQPIGDVELQAESSVLPSKHPPRMEYTEPVFVQSCPSVAQPHWCDPAFIESDTKEPR